MMAGLGVAAAALPLPNALAEPPQPDAPAPGPQGQAQAGMLFADDFDGPAGSSIDYSKWRVMPARERIKNPVFWDRPENMGEYRDSRENLFLDGKGNLVIRATKEGTSTSAPRSSAPSRWASEARGKPGSSSSA